jgi:hypothetical protein
MTAEREQWWYMVHNHWSEEAQERNRNKKPVSRYRRQSYKRPKVATRKKKQSEEPKKKKATKEPVVWVQRNI